MMNDHGQAGHDWTVVLRRRPVPIVAGRTEDGYTGEFEIICCRCGDDRDLDYREVSPERQRIRGPYPVAAGITQYLKHTGWHPRPQEIQRSGRRPATATPDHPASAR